jgi:hypothetical protein
MPTFAANVLKRHSSGKFYARRPDAMIVPLAATCAPGLWGGTGFQPVVSGILAETVRHSPISTVGWASYLRMNGLS